jgi:hypothetical protein
MGIDNSNSDKLVIGSGYSPGASDYLTISSTGLAVTGALSATGDITVNKANPAILLSAAAAAQTASYYTQTAGVDRWQWGKGNTAESGSDAGSDYFMNRFSDAGAYLGTPFTISRATGLAAFATSLAVTGTLDARLAASGSGAVVTVGNVNNGQFGGFGITDGAPYPLEVWGNVLVFKTNGASYASTAEKMRLDSNGYLGVGEAVPVSRIHVSGAAFGATTQIRIASTSASNSGAPSLVLTRSSSSTMTAQGIGNIYFSRLLTDAASNTAASIVATGNNSSSAPTCTLTYDAITNHVLQINGTGVSTFSSTGLAVTGTLSATPSGSTSAVAVGTVSGYGVLFFNGGAASLSTSSGIFGGGGDPSIYLAATTGASVFARVGGSTRGEFSSTGLAVTGTLSATSTITASAGRVVAGNSGINDALFQATNTGGTLYMGLDNSGGGFGTAGAYGTVIYRPAATSFAISRAGTVDLRIDASGNLGLGVTPSAWYNSGTLQGTSFGISVLLGVDQTGFSTGCYQDGYGLALNWKSKGAYRPTLYAQASGAHQFYISTALPTGAGQAIAWTEAMTLTAAGDLLVGKTATALGTAGIELQAVGFLAVTRAERPFVLNRLTTDGDLIELYRDSVTKATIGITSSNLTFGVGGATWMTLTTSGNLAFSATGAAISNVTSINGGQLAGLRNRIINGNMSVWQYWTYVSNPVSGSFLADRWTVYSLGTAAALATQSSNVPNAQSLYSLLANGSAGNTMLAFNQRIESLNMYDMSGQVVTVSAWVYSSDSRAATVTLYYPTATDNYIGFVDLGANVSAAATGWRKVSYQYTIPAQQFGLQLTLSFGAVGAGISVGIAQVQIEIGSVATTFEQRSFGLELSLCQRYYVKVGANAIGAAASSTIADVFLTFPVTMRTAPTFTALDTSVDIRINGTTLSYAGAWASLSSGVDTAIINFTLTSGSWPGTNLFVVNSTPVVAASAEI